jgi:hypothetical protein
VFLTTIRLQNLRMLRFFLLLAVLIPNILCAQKTRSSEMRVENAKWKVDNGVVVITYELIAPLEKTYDVRVLLRRETDSAFAFIPKELTGAIGRGEYAGTEEQIRWDFEKEVPGGFLGDDYWFEITAREVVDEGGIKWWHYTVGGVVLSGAAALLLRKGTGGGAAPPVSTLPDPPTSRPIR